MTSGSKPDQVSIKVNRKNSLTSAEAVSAQPLTLHDLLCLDGLRASWEDKKLHLVIKAIFSINGISTYKVFSVCE